MKFRTGSRVLVKHINATGLPVFLDPPRPGTVVRLMLRDDSAWVKLDERLDHAAHPFPADDPRGCNVIVWPEDCDVERQAERVKARGESR